VARVSGDPDAHVIPHGPLLEALVTGAEPLLAAVDLARLPLGAEHGFWLASELQSSFQELAAHKPVLVCVDDLQWCDPATLRLLRLLPQRLATEAIVWVVAVRDGERSPALASTKQTLVDAGATVLRLLPLDDSAVRQITTDVLHAKPDARVWASVARAGGQPLLVVELLKGLVVERLIRVQDGTAELVSDEVPARLRDAVARRIQRLSQPARELLQVAAVLGRACPPILLADVLGLAAPALLSPTQEVIDAGLMSDDGEQISFSHDLIREAVAASMPAGLVRVVRRHAVDVLVARGASTLQVATMMAESATPGDMEAVLVLRDAAAALASRSATAAADFSVRALTLLPRDSALRTEVVVESVMLLWQAGRTTAAQNLASPMLEVGVGTDSAGEAQVRLALARFLGRYSSAAAISECEKALRLADLPDRLRAELHLVLAVNHGLSGNPDAADAAMAPVAQRLEQQPDPDLASTLARSRVWSTFHRRQWGTAFDCYREVKRHGPADDMTAPLSMWESAMWTAIGHPARSLALIEPELARATADQRIGPVLMWRSMRARALYDAGQLDEARWEAEEILDLEEMDIGGGMRDLLVVYSLVRGGLDAGRPDVVRVHQEAVRRMTTDPVGQIRRNGLWLEALIADRNDDVMSARAAVAEAVVMLGLPGPALAGLPDVHDEVVLTRMALRQGDDRLAAQAVEAAEQRASANPGYPTAEACANHARGLLDGDEHCLREALGQCDAERPLVRASALEDLGSMVARVTTTEAVGLLDDALSLYAAAGAEPHAARVRGKLRSLGVRRTRSALPSSGRGLASLTPGERDVVRLVAEGGTNRQVAQQLFLSPHTVNTHLRNAFGQLGVRSRVELTRLVANEDNV
jgi:DNA-binding CsgD family transcriptional regulator